MVMLSAGQSFNQYLFTGAVPPSIADDRTQTRPKLKARRAFLHFDNAGPHLTTEQSDDFGITRLPYPPDSPDLSPCDSWLFGHLQHCLEGRVLDDDLAVKGAMSEILESIESNVLMRVFQEWRDLLRQYIDQGGDYL
jgi:hypothetical protein